MNRALSMALAAIFLIAGGALGAEREQGMTLVNPVSDSPLEYYAQGGVVVNGIAYFTSDDGGSVKTGIRSKEFKGITAFDVKTLKPVRKYHFDFMYDSSPYLFQKKDGTWLIIAHEHPSNWTAARTVDTDELAWTSEGNQPGKMFFGYSSFKRADGTQLILMACDNGLHAMSGETGKDVWVSKQTSGGGITPAVDQKNGWVYYQCDGKLLKLQAEDGKVLEEKPIEAPSACVAWNTVLVDDSNGYFVVTRWFGKPVWDTAIRVYDKDLKPVWEKTGLAIGKKDTLTYAEGKLLSGTGNHWGHKDYNAGPDTWKVLRAYSVKDGSVAWECSLKHLSYESLPNTPYFNGCFYAEVTGGLYGPSHLLRIDAKDGKIVDDFNYGRSIDSCASTIIARGCALSGDLQEDRIVVTKLAEDSNADWPGPFGQTQTNQCAAPKEEGVKLVKMQELGRTPKADK